MNGALNDGDETAPMPPTGGIGSDDPTIPGEQLRPDPRAEAAAALANNDLALDRRSLREPVTEDLAASDPLDGDAEALDEVPQELDGVTTEDLAGPRGRRIAIAVIASLLVVGVVAAAVIILAMRDDGDDANADPVPPISSVAPSEESESSPNVSASSVPTDSAAFDLLPAKVGSFKVISATEVKEMRDGGAKEAYEVGYSDGTDEVTVIVGTWDNPEKSLAWATATSAAFPAEALYDSGEVDVDDSGAGQFWQYSTETGQEIIWTKGIRAMAFVGPNGATQALYSQFPF